MTFLNLTNNFKKNVFNIFFTYMKMSKDSSIKYYKDKKKDYRKSSWKISKCF